MSGGSYNYIYSTLHNECAGEMYDKEMDAMILDLCEVLHALEWWQSADWSEESYRTRVSKFKDKWFKKEEQEPCEDCISREQTKSEIRKAFPQLKDRVEINSILNGLPSVKQETCEDYISREKVCDYIAEFINHEYSTDAECEMVDIMIEGIKHLPSVKREPKIEQAIRDELNKLSTYRVPNSTTDLVPVKAVERVLNLVFRGHRDKEPKTGRWIVDEYGIKHCPFCNAINNTVYDRYCSNCGSFNGGGA